MAAGGRPLHGEKTAGNATQCAHEVSNQVCNVVDGDSPPIAGLSPAQGPVTTHGRFCGQDPQPQPYRPPDGGEDEADIWPGRGFAYRVVFLCTATSGEATTAELGRAAI